MEMPDDPEYYCIDDNYVTEDDYNRMVDEMCKKLDYQVIGYNQNGVDITDLVLGYEEGPKIDNMTSICDK